MTSFDTTSSKPATEPRFREGLARLAARVTILAAMLFGVAGCQDNLTVPDRDKYTSKEPEPLTCVPNLDGVIDSTEIQPAIGVPVNYLISPDGVERDVDLLGEGSGDDLVWDWSVDLADDQLLVVTATALADKWYAASFPADAFVTPADPSGRLESVTRHDSAGLHLLGIASREPAPAEGQTLLVYNPPVTVLRFPVEPGSQYVSVGSITNGMLFGLPYAGTDTYEISVPARGLLHLPQLSFEQAQQVRTRVTVSPAVGAPTTQRQVSYFFECFAEVARAVSHADEPDENFTVAAEVWRLGF